MLPNGYTCHFPRPGPGIVFDSLARFAGLWKRSDLDARPGTHPGGDQGFSPV